MLEFDLLAHNPYTPDQLHISYDPSLRVTMTPQQQARIETRWQERLAFAHEHNFRLYDGQLFRLVAIEPRNDGTLHLTLGDTGYKDYVATRYDEEEYNRPRFERANPLSVCGAAETSDGYILLERRPVTGIHAGRYHVIGGFTDRTLDMHDGHIDLYGAMSRELREETGIQQEDIGEQICLGAAYDLLQPHPELCFGIQLKISYEEVLQREPEDNEIEQMLTVRATPDGLRDFICTNRGKISPTGEPTLLLYGAYRFGKAWYEDIMNRIL